MQRPWIRSVKDSGKLTVYDGIEEGRWAGVFKYLISNFSGLTHKKVSLVEESDMNAANVVMQLSDGNSSFTYAGATANAIFPGTAAHGKTLIFRVDDLVEKAAVFLPRNPSENHVNHLRFIAAHELVHACGFVTNDEHANDGVFMSFPNFLQGGKISASADSKKMPPYFLASKTQSGLGALW